MAVLGALPLRPRPQAVTGMIGVLAYEVQVLLRHRGGRFGCGNKPATPREQRPCGRHPIAAVDVGRDRKPDRLREERRCGVSDLTYLLDPRGAFDDPVGRE